MPISLLFITKKNLLALLFQSIIRKLFYVSFFAIMPHLRSHGYGQEIIEKIGGILPKDHDS